MCGRSPYTALLSRCNRLHLPLSGCREGFRVGIAPASDVVTVPFVAAESTAAEFGTVGE
jgi:hypothetical protein